MQTSNQSNEQRKIAIEKASAPLPNSVMVKTLANEVHFIEYKHEDLSFTFSQFKKALEPIVGIPTHEQCLMFKGKKLHDGTRLEDYGFSLEAMKGLPLHVFRIHKDSNLLGADGRIRIHVRMLSGKTLELAVNRSGTVRTLKEQLYEREGIPIEALRLVMPPRTQMFPNNVNVRPRPLEDEDQPLSQESDFIDGTTIVLIVRSR